MRIGFFGAGNMVEAIALGLFNKDQGHTFYFYTPSKTKAKNMAFKTNGIFVEELAQMPLDLDWYVLGFKPFQLSEFQFNFHQDAKIISLLASTSIESIENKFFVSKILRVMPNTPSKVYQGMNLLYFSKFVGNSNRDEVLNIFRSIGEFLIVDQEKEIDLLTPYTGSGPGIFFEILDYFEKSISTEISSKYDTKKLLAQTLLGTAKLALESNDSFSLLRDQVTSKKGVTIEAINELRDSNTEIIIKKSMDRALKRLNEMKEENQ